MYFQDCTQSAVTAQLSENRSSSSQGEDVPAAKRARLENTQAVALPIPKCPPKVLFPQHAVPVTNQATTKPSSPDVTVSICMHKDTQYTFN